MHRSTRRSVATTALAACTLGACGPPAASAAADPVATATYGQAQIGSFRASGGYELRYTPSDGAAPTVVDVKLPSGLTSRNQALGLGLDATGLLTVVIQSPKGLFWTHVTRPDGLHKLGSTRGAESPAIYKGRVAYVCQSSRAICLASLRTKSRRILDRQPKGSQWIFGDVRIGPKNAIATQAERDGALGASRVQIKRAATKTARTIADANLDTGREIGLRDLSPDGKILTLVRTRETDDGVDETLLRYRFPSGKRAK